MLPIFQVCSHHGQNALYLANLILTGILIHAYVKYLDYSSGINILVRLHPVETQMQILKDQFKRYKQIHLLKDKKY